MSDELKPCPFCGGLAEIVEIDEGENAGGSCVCCTTCLASSKVEFGFKENFISNWNRRVQTIAPDAVARLWHAARLGLDMARANDLTNTAEMIMEAMNAVECPCKGSDEMCPCQNRRPAPDAVAPLVEAAQALGAMPEGYCFCSANRVGDDRKIHEPECADLRAALAAMEASDDRA